MRRTWLIFSQAVTVAVAVLFVVATLKPEWLRNGAAIAPPGLVTLPAPAVPTGVSSTAPGAVVVNSYAAAARLATPAVVSVTARKPPLRNAQSNDPWFRFFFGDRAQQQQQPQVGLGSGVIVSPQGYLLTNNHVVEGADDIEVQLTDGRQANAKLIGTDPETDLAVLKIDLDRLPALAFGDVEHAAGRRRGARDRQPVQRRPDRHLGHRQRARARPARHQHLRELHPDRRRDQPRQLGRRAGRRERQPGRHQHRDLLAHAAAAWASASRSPSAPRAR